LVGTIAKKFKKRRHKSAVAGEDSAVKRNKTNRAQKGEQSKVQKKFIKPEDD